MSRIGNSPIKIPEGVNINLQNNKIIVSGKLGSLELNFRDIDVDIENLNLGDSIRLTEISLPEGSEIPGLTDETDQMVVSVNAPKAVEEDPIVEEDLEDGEVAEGEEASDSGSEETSSSDESSSEENSEES